MIRQESIGELVSGVLLSASFSALPFGTSVMSVSANVVRSFSALVRTRSEIGLNSAVGESSRMNMVWLREGEVAHARTTFLFVG